jgi:membrane-bound lytic murein transglycosylase A
MRTEPDPVSAAPVVPATPPVASSETPAIASRTLTRALWSELPGWQQDNHAEALPALLTSCTVLSKQGVWREPCEAASSVNGRAAARLFFENHFIPYRVAGSDGSAEGFITGYYEPTLRGSRKPSARNRYPLYGAPGDLLVLDLGDLAPELKASAPRVRIVGNRVVPYYTRAQIDGEGAPLRGKEIAWVEDAIELFFLQVQGSGRIALEEGGIMRVGFAGHNGHPYRSIGRVLIERGELTLERASMQGIKAWARANPTRLSELLNQNLRYVFFRELHGNGAAPPGALGVPLTPERSIAIDPRYIPLGAPVHIATTWPNAEKPLQRLMLAQDTGGAIRGAVRADFFWGNGEEAAREAGRMQQSLRMWVLLPIGHPLDPKP